MSIAVQENGIARGFARHAKDEKRLRAAGVKTIYRADKGELPGKFKMRKGELLGVVDGLLAFGERRSDWTEAEELVHSWGAAIFDIDSKLRSDLNGAKMFSRALTPPRPSDEYRAMQEAGLKVRIKGRMPEREAIIIWRNPRLSTAEAVALMKGWSQSTAYNHLHERNVPAGRRNKKRNTAPIIDHNPDFKPMPSRRGRKGKVYFIKSSDGPIKIGFAVNVESRMNRLQTSTHAGLKILCAVDGTHKTEHDFHKRFAEYRIHPKREWFKHAGKLRKFIVETRAK
jgi:hypothetical protein